MSAWSLSVSLLVLYRDRNLLEHLGFNLTTALSYQLLALSYVLLAPTTSARSSFNSGAKS